MLVLNALLAFAVEIAALFAWGLFGWTLFDGPLARILTAAVAVVAFALLWGRFAAPKSSRRLVQPWLAPFKAVMFASGAGALAAAGHHVPGLSLAAIGAVQIGLALALGAL